MRSRIVVLLFATVTFAQSPSPELPRKDAVRIHEFYRLSAQIGDQVWPNWGTTPAPLLLVTPTTEFLTHYPDPPSGFTKVADDIYARSRQFSTSLLATFPAFGPLSTIVIGEAENTDAKTSTPWLLTLMHEHFHQIQDSRPGYFEAVNRLGLAHGDKTGMWMLNYPFPYGNPELVKSFGQLRNLLLTTLNEQDNDRFYGLVRQYIEERQRFFAQLRDDDHKYLSFQLWQEGVARYVQIRAAEIAVRYRPTPEYKVLADYEPFDKYAAKARTDTVSQLERVDLAKWKRGAVYPFGACEALLLDRLNPKWKEGYFQNLFTLDVYFQSDR